MKYINFILLLLLTPAYAGMYPVVTSIRTNTVTSTYKHYNITVKPMEIGPAVDSLMNQNDHIVLSHKHYSDDNSDPDSGSSAGHRDATGTKTLSEEAMLLYNQLGPNNVLDHNSFSPLVIHTDECVGYFVIDASQPTDHAPWQEVKTPGGCLIVPPADEWCKITTPELLLDHGTILLKNAEGHSASAPMGVNCTTPMSVTFNLITGQPYIYLQPAGQATITVGDRPLNSEIDLPSGPSTLTVKDMLSGVNTEGVSSGSSVLVMMPY